MPRSLRAARSRCKAALEQLDLPAHGLPDTLALRLGGHFGPVFETTDPVQGVTNYFGAHVSRTARIEPVTPPGEVYVTEQFAARLALEPAGFGCDYVGQVPAAKGYGTMRMYHLHARPKRSKSTFGVRGAYLQPERHRAVVYQTYLHVRGESAGFDERVTRAGQLDEAQVELLALGRGRRR
jgi:hypothetical protein